MGWPDGSEVPILYCKHSAISAIEGDLSFHLCSAINTIHKNQALGAQKLKTLWIIVVRTFEVRDSLLTSGITVNNTNIKLYAQNPYDIDIAVETERILIKDLPLWEPNSLVSDFFKEQSHIKPTSDVMFSKARNNNTNRSSTFLNGDRFLYVQSGFKPPLPANIKIGKYTCRVWRPTKKSTKCNRCASTDHNTMDITKCDAYVPKVDNTLVFTRGVLSNFDRCAVEMDGLKFVTSEHTYQWRACTEALREDLAEKVIAAKFPIDAKKIAEEVKDDNPKSHWNVIKFDVMREVLQAKINSSATFRQALLDTGDMKLAEGREDMTWGSGLSFNLTITTKSAYWPGSNKLGSILESLRAKLRSSEVEVTASSSKETPVAIPVIASPASRSRSVHKPGSLRKSSQKVTPSTSRLKKNGRPLYKVFMKNRVSKRRKRQLTGSSNSDQGVDTGGSSMDTASESSFVSTRDHVCEAPNDLRDFDS